MNRTKYKNEFKKKYDRVEVLLAKGQKNKLEDHCKTLGILISEYIRTLIANDIVSNSVLFSKPVNINASGLDGLLTKWQVAKKYRHMIEDASYSKKDGYFIKLKAGYINTVTNTRIIKVKTTREMRLTVNKSREVKVSKSESCLP